MAGRQQLGLLGRDAERERLEELIATTAAGGGGAVLVHGEAGVGKSALLDHARRAAESFEVLRATGVEAESELPFSALADLVSPVLCHAADIPAAQGRALRRALRVEGEPVADRFAVYAGARSLLARAAQDRPVVVLVDDAHWIDAASREALVFCARRSAEARIAVVLATRDGSGADLCDAGLDEVALDGLPEAAGVELATRSAPRLAPAVGRALHAGTSGNPLAIVEIARGLSADQVVGRVPLVDPLPVGTRLQNLFAERVRTLGGAACEALLVAAASETGRMDTILPALEHAELSREALHEAELAGLVQIEAGTLAFRHPLVRSAIYHGASPVDRRAAHRALALAARDDTPFDHRAWHLAAAAEAPDEDVAAQLARLAEDAEQSGGTAVVSRILERAALLTPAPARRAERLAAAAEAAIAIGATERAHALLDKAAPQADRHAMAQIERLRARADVLLGIPQAAHERLVRTAQAWREEDPALASTLLCEAVVADMAQGTQDQYLETAEAAFEMAHVAGPAAEPLPAVLLAMGLVANGSSDEGIELLDRYSDVANSPELWRAAPEMVGMVALTWIWIERFDEAERLLTAVTASARRDGALRPLAFPLAVLAELNFRLGRWPTARAMGEESVRLAEDLGEGALLANNLGYLARFQAALGDSKAARANAERVLATCRAQNLQAIIPHALYALGLVALASGQHAEAVRHLTAVAELDTFSHEPGLAIWDQELIEALVRAGERKEAEARLLALERDVNATGRPRGHAVLGRLRGLLADERDLDRTFGEALGWHERTRLPFEQARTRLAYGERLRRARRRADARAQLGAATAAFEQLGARQFAAWARAELRAAGAREEHPHAGDPWKLLTAQEARVVEAVAGGATYREAADSLFLSHRTVEHHLRNAYRKLGIRSRSELAIRLGHQRGSA